MKQHLKSRFIWAKVNGVGINKVLIDLATEINLMPHSSLRKIGKYEIDLRPHNMVMSNYEGKTSKYLKVIQVDINVSTTITPTLFVVITTKANYNLLLG